MRNVNIVRAFRNYDMDAIYIVTCALDYLARHKDDDDVLNRYGHHIDKCFEKFSKEKA